jgi:hypothetical protein
MSGTLDNPIQKNEESDKELEVYRAAIKNLIELNGTTLISNAKPEHAAVIFEQFFVHAKSVKIFCSNLSRDVFGKDFVVKAASEAIDKRTNIEILIQEPAPQESAFTQLLKNRRVSVRRVAPPFQDFGSNFTIMNDTSYRFEPKKTEKVATANMYDPSVAKSLVSSFDLIKNTSSEISL